MHKKLIVLVFITFVTCAMMPPAMPPSAKNSMPPEMAAKFKALIGQKIPWTLNDAQYSNDHRFEVEELVAIPSSNFWETKGEQEARYGQIKAIESKEKIVKVSIYPGDWTDSLTQSIQEITVAYGTPDLPIEKTTEESKQIGKLSQEAIQKALKTITTQAKATRK